MANPGQGRIDRRPAAILAAGMRRREFIALLGGAAVAWPFRARAQQSDRMRRIGVLMSIADDPDAELRLVSFHQALRALGWTEGQNLRIDYRWAAGDPDAMQTYAAELVGSAPDVLLANGAPALGALTQRTHTIPIIFVLWSSTRSAVASSRA